MDPKNGAPFPWGLDSTVTGPGSLTPEQKKWFVSQHVDEGVSAARLGRRFQLNHHTIYQWVKTFRKTGKLEGKRGRPRLLDEQSMEGVDSYCAINGYGDTKELREKIRTSRKKQKVGNDVNQDDIPVGELSRRSMLRYITLLRTGHQEPSISTNTGASASDSANVAPVPSTSTSSSSSASPEVSSTGT
mmetsp:Transcript_12133/g.26670  ORF Transcript_12133/g.26670 Transcript_12133/m.26670 type:complete len:188 (+) Transcript_12133:138-701(+)